MEHEGAYALFHRAVLLLYDEGLLTPGLLDALGRAWNLAEIDPADMPADNPGVVTRDGKTLHEICIELVYPGWAPPGFPSLRAYYAAWEGLDDDAREEGYGTWSDICCDRWGWRPG